MAGKHKLRVTVIPHEEVEQQYRAFSRLTSSDIDPEQTKVIEALISLPLGGHTKLIVVSGKNLKETQLAALENTINHTNKIRDCCLCKIEAESDIFCIFLPSPLVLSAMKNKALLGIADHVRLGHEIKHSIPVHIT